ncbi:MAG: mRNA surveillance protein pelota [Theionarchaea archaeon]|nr:mRNA surveillance protein pelota [Theionarchaea archaeon]MBU6999211.1 mRNA surveillance protein pelota [Theionarchaea archaeon]MBU7019664.1 mRNA surveillance protein pelota [Theionarchaea archaeon]MBU7034585.1 mRNA surveillance protein pelota [Theionarchaea archaeon]MBU7041310.1 mRNA surveillance protein pelota [Theionarchaea archaeon]
MQILSYHPERGTISLQIESLEDLWHLDHILEEGDLLKARTYRRTDQPSDMLRPQRAEKKPVTLIIRIEKVEFHPHSNWLRATGVIEGGEDAGSYHTINLEEGSRCTIIKQWRQYHLERLKEAVQQSKTPRILLVAMDDEQADFGVVRQYGIEEVATVHARIPGKREPSQRKAAKNQYFKEISAKISEYDLPTIVAGPGFTKEEFRKFLMDTGGKQVEVESVSTTGKTGLYEVVKRGLVEKVYQDSKTARDIQLIEELFAKIITNDAVYGLEDVKKAVAYSACQDLLVVDTVLRTNREAEHLMEQARQRGGKTHIISSQHEGGEKLLHLGGIAAFLRFKIE